MTRISTAEMYDDKDVITQICKLKDGLNSALGGIIADIDIVNDELVIDWADGTNISLPLPSPTGISSIAGSISGTNLTITIYMTDGSSHAFTTPLNGIATESYVDAKDTQNVKLTGAQTVAGVKTFSDSPIVPTVPAMGGAINDIYANDATEGTNNIVHKTGNEKINGLKTFTGDITKSSTADITTTATTYVNIASINIVDVNNVNAAQIRRDRLAGDIDRLYLSLNKPVGSDTYGIRFDLTINGSGICTLSVNKQKNGSTISTQQLWSV